MRLSFLSVCLEMMMRYMVLLFFSFFLISCAGNAHLRRVVHQTPEFLVELDQVKIATSPDFPSPYEHPFLISPEALQDVLQPIEVIPGGGFLRMLFSGKKKQRSIFLSKDMASVSKQLSKALAAAGPSEKVHFHYAIPKDSSKVLVSSGVLVFKDNRLHLRLNYYRLPMKKGRLLRTAERSIPRSEKGRYSFTLFEDELRRHRQYKNAIGFDATDEHWLVMDYQGIAAKALLPQNPISPAPIKTVEERLRRLKRFKEEGLINEQEYRKKKAALLRAF